MLGSEWQDIRALRAAPTGHARTDPAAAATFRAALTQAEELAEAADVAGYASNALPLFYALEQAGHAIAAARPPGAGHRLTNHGLSFLLKDSANVLRGVVGPPPNGRTGTYQAICDALGSETLPADVEVGALWAANPDLEGVPVPSEFGEWRRPIVRVIGARDAGVNTDTMEQLDPDSTMTQTGGRIRGYAKIPGSTVADVARELSAYPSLANVQVLAHGPNGTVFGSPSDRTFRSLDNTLAKLGLPVADPLTYTDYWRLEDSMYSVVEDYRDTPVNEPAPYKVGYALPALGGGPAPAPLMLWWALLLGLSSLVRYHPAAWTNAINLDASTLAVHLQRVLDIAAKRVPERLLGALRA